MIVRGPRRHRALVLAKRGGICVLLTLLVWLGACGEDSPVGPTDNSIRIPAVSISGVGSSRVGSVELKDGVGFCDIDGTHVPAAVYWAQSWDAYGLTVFHVIAPTVGELHVLYVYSVTDTLQTIWHESYTHPLAYENASGIASYDGHLVESTPNLQCLGEAPNESQLVDGVTITGPLLNWGAGSGTIEIEQREYGCYPFQLVDCSDCGTTATDGWFELHSVFRGPQDQIEFGILYLFVEDPRHVILHHRIQLCDLWLGPSTTYEADWSIAPAVNSRLHPLWFSPAVHP